MERVRVTVTYQEMTTFKGSFLAFLRAKGIDPLQPCMRIDHLATQTYEYIQPPLEGIALENRVRYG